MSPIEFGYQIPGSWHIRENFKLMILPEQSISVHFSQSQNPEAYQDETGDRPSVALPNFYPAIR